MAYKKILVTGGTALVGSAVKSIEKNYPNSQFTFLSSKECDLTNSKATLQYFQNLKPDAVIHLAAKSGGLGLNAKYPATLLRDNVQMTLNVLEAARLAEVKKTVMTLSTGMYPSEAPLPLKEESIHQGPAHPSVAAYSYAKRLIDPAITAYRAEYKMNVIGLVPNGVFGPHDSFNLETATMLPSLIRRFYEKQKSQDPIQIWGDGKPLREYTFSQDVARAFMWCLENYDDEMILNIGSTEEHSVREIAFMIAEALDISRDRIEFDISKPAGVFRKSTDNSKFLALSRFQYTSLKEGIRQTVKWFAETSKKNQPDLRLHDKVKNEKTEKEMI